MQIYRITQFQQQNCNTFEQYLVIFVRRYLLYIQYILLKISNTIKYISISLMFMYIHAYLSSPSSIYKQKSNKLQTKLSYESVLRIKPIVKVLSIQIVMRIFLDDPIIKNKHLLRIGDTTFEKVVTLHIIICTSLTRTF